MSNQIQIIAPYWLHGIWVFDDPVADLVQEPFVNGVPEMIDDLVRDIPDARSGFRLLFSSAPFPGFQRRLEWVREEMDGNWYRADQPISEGWLCPALFRYFDVAPAELYVKAEAMKPEMEKQEKETVMPDDNWHEDFGDCPSVEERYPDDEAKEYADLWRRSERAGWFPP